MQTILDPSTIPQVSGARVAILQAKWYREQMDNMVATCVRHLKAAGVPEPEHHILPGSLELPLAAQSLVRAARQAGQPFEAVICFGGILKGDTYHFEMIMDQCTRGFGHVTLNEEVPIIMEVIPVTAVEQLAARSKDDAFNKGIEAALAAAEIIHWRRTVLGIKGA